MDIVCDFIRWCIVVLKLSKVDLLKSYSVKIFIYIRSGYVYLIALYYRLKKYMKNQSTIFEIEN